MGTLIVFAWNIVVSGVAVFGASKLLPGVKCRSFMDAVWVALLYAIFASVASWFLFWIGLATLIASNVIPLLGPLAVIGVFPFVAFFVSAVCLWAADQVIEGFEIESFGMTLATAFVIFLLTIPLSILHIGG